MTDSPLTSRPGEHAGPGPDDPRRSPRIIALMNQKGGVGKTTTTVNLGAALAEVPRRVLLIDLDPQAHLTLHLGADPDQLDATVYNLLVSDSVQAPDIVQSIEGYEERGGRLDVVPANVNLAGVEAELAPRMVTGQAQRILKNKIDVLLNNGPGYDYVFIDCPPSLGLLTINALTLAREVIVPMQPHFLALQGLSKLLETVELIQQGFNPDLKVSGMVLCMHEGQTLLANEVVADLKTFLDASRSMSVPWSRAVVYDPPIRRNIKLAESPSFGMTVFQYAGSSNGAADYRQLAASVDRGQEITEASIRRIMEQGEGDAQPAAQPESSPVRGEAAETLNEAAHTQASESSPSPVQIVDTSAFQHAAASSEPMSSQDHDNGQQSSHEEHGQAEQARQHAGSGSHLS